MPKGSQDLLVVKGHFASLALILAYPSDHLSGFLHVYLAAFLGALFPLMGLGFHNGECFVASRGSVQTAICAGLHAGLTELDLECET
jgi:hypothetical protein